MTIDIKSALTPVRKEDGGLDNRYSGVVGRIITAAGSDTIKGIEEFESVTSDAEKQYGGYFLKFALAVYQETDNYEFNAMRKPLRELFQEAGMKPQKVSYTLGAAEFLNHKRGSASYDWIAKHSVGLIYEMNRISDMAFALLWEQSEFGERLVTRDEIRKAADKKPIPAKELKKSLPSSSSNSDAPTDWRDNKFSQGQSSTPVPQAQPAITYQTIDIPSNSVSTEVVDDVEQVEKLDTTARNVMRLVEVLSSISVDDVFARPELVEQIRPYQGTLDTLNDLVKPKASGFRR